MAGGACLDPAGFITPIVRSRTVNGVKDARVVLVERYLKVSRGRVIEKVHCVPLDVKGAVRRSASSGGENAAPVCPGGAAAQTDIGLQVVLIRQNGHVPKRIRQGETAMGERRLIADKVQRAIGADVGSGKALPIHAHGEWERNGRRAIVAMVACVGDAGHDRIGARSGGVGAARYRCPRWCRRWCWGCACGRRCSATAY